MKLLSLVFLVICVTAVSGMVESATIRTARLGDRIFLNAGTDTITVVFEKDRIPFRPADFKNGDSVRLVFDDTSGGKVPLWLFGRQDSLGILLLDTAVDVHLIAGSDTVITRYVLFAQQPPSHFIELLRRTDSFGGSEKLPALEFTYAGKETAPLADLRQRFALDSIAGTGDELSRLMNLMHWVHTTVHHDGGAESPPNYRVADLLTKATQGEVRVNCGMLTDIMNEVFLAAGFFSRRLVCLPYDTADTECHSINVVWSTEFGKWLYVDPTFEGMCRDTSGRWLSIMEVRHAVASRDTFVISENLNWNGQPKSRDEYLWYMAKNLFRFSCLSHSAWPDRNTPDTVYWVFLSPTGYTQARHERIDAGSSLIRVYTDDTANFWAPPKQTESKHEN